MILLIKVIPCVRLCICLSVLLSFCVSARLSIHKSLSCLQTDVYARVILSWPPSFSVSDAGYKF